MQFTNNEATQVKVQYKLAGKVYGVSNGDQADFDDGKTTSYPFEEQWVQPGQTVDLGNTTWVNEVKAVEVSADSEKSFGDFAATGTQSA